jgi:beta-phosphoglucomutase family hydrolase
MQMSGIQAVIFDLDGTLIDSEPNYFEAEKKLLAEYGITGFDFEMKKPYVGISTKEMLEDLNQKYSFSDPIEVLIAKKNKIYLDIAKRKTHVFPEMKKFLHILQENKVKLALASGSSPDIIEEILSVTRLSAFFDTVVSSENVKKGKPEPDVFLEAARQIAIRPERCLVVEDSPYGVEAAKRAGMYCVAIPYLAEEPLPDSFQKADYLVKEGMRCFSAEKTFAWLRQTGHSS